MGYSQQNGYVPADIDAIMLNLMEKINVQFGQSYTAETFQGTNFYKYYYGMAQKLQENEVRTSEIFAKLQQYFIQTNEAIARPPTTAPGIIEKLKDAGFVASVKPMIDADAGKANVCVIVNDGVHASGTVTITAYANLVSGTPDSVGVNGTNFTAQAGAATPGTATFQALTSNAATAASLALQINSHATVGLVVRATVVGAVVTITARQGGTAGNSIALDYTNNDANVGATKSGTVLSGGTTEPTYAANKLLIGTLLSTSIVGGAVTQGLEVQPIVLSNGQSFDFKYWLPIKYAVKLRLTITTSTNNQVFIESQTVIKDRLLANIVARYSLGKNFEPQRYFSVIDAPWASQTLLEYSLDDGATWASTVYVAAFWDLFDVKLENISVVEV